MDSNKLIDTRAPLESSATSIVPGARVATVAFIASFLVFEYHPTGGDVPIPLFYPLVAAFGIATVASLGRSNQRWGGPVAVFFIGSLFLFPSYLIFTDTTSNFEGSEAQYLTAGLISLVTLVIAATLANVFYDEALFAKYWYRLATLATAIALGAYLVAETAGDNILTTFAEYGGGIRLTGLLSEPSAWAPVLPGILLLAWSKRHWPIVLLALAAILFVRSPTVTLTTILTVAFLLLVGPAKATSKIIGSVIAGIVFTIALPVLRSPDLSNSLISSGNPFQIMLGRLLGGLEFLSSDGTAGNNDRADGLEVVWENTRDQAWLLFGRGLDSSQVYFPETMGGTVFTYNLPSQLLFDIGIIGTSIFLFFLTKTLWRLRNLTIGFIFIPFIFACLINSAQGGATYKFVWLAIFVYGVGSQASIDKRRSSKLTGRRPNTLASPDCA